MADLQTLAAESAIRRLVSLYCDAVNQRDADAAAALFAPDATICIAGAPELSGQAAIAEGMRKTFAMFDFMRQQCDTGLIDVDGDTARSRLAVLEITRRQNDEALSLILGIYEDQYSGIGHRWFFQRRRFTLQARARLPVAKMQLMPDFAPLFGLAE